MAFEVRSYTLTVPTGTLPAAPFTLDVSFPPRNVDAVQVIVPPGPSGLVGWRILNSRVPVIPYGSDPWIITAGEIITWPLSGQITSGSWQVQGYNTGTVDHSVYFRFLLSLVAGKAQRTPDLIDESLIGPSDFPLFSDTGGG